MGNDKLSPFLGAFNIEGSDFWSNEEHDERAVNFYRKVPKWVPYFHSAKLTLHQCVAKRANRGGALLVPVCGRAGSLPFV